MLAEYVLLHGAVQLSAQEVNALSSPRPVGNTSVLCRVHTVLPAPLPRTRHMHAAWLLVTLVITSTHIYTTHIYTYLRCTLSTLTLTLTTLPPSYNIYTTHIYTAHIYTAHIYKYLHCTYLNIYHNACTIIFVIGCQCTALSAV